MVVRLDLGEWIQEEVDGCITYDTISVQRLIYSDDCHQSHAGGIEMVLPELPPEVEHRHVGHRVKVRTGCLGFEDTLVTAVIHFQVHLTHCDLIGAVPDGIDIEIYSHTLFEGLVGPLLLREGNVRSVV